MLIFFDDPGLDEGITVLDGVAQLRLAFVFFAASFFDT
jgi:hypothetical protein